ncbi:methylamine utilization protein [Arenimonas sp. MALMAid1274]|uniref:methylamine utilization protein n=1 Tax=Arenimonas sp. MALMAid1274 TaxID=3411630 RepID=UPI003B9EA874
MAVFHRLGGYAGLLFVLALSGPVQAAPLKIAVSDGPAPVPDAVVSLHAEAVPLQGGEAVMDQRNSAFEPGVLAVQVGTRVSFPNSDTVQHQVYSFSAPKPFELPLYSGTPQAPVLFDRPGVVVVGCNIHDWMIGYIVVLETPYFGKTDAQGRVAVAAPPGKYRLRVWHARQKAPLADRDVVIGPGQVPVDLSLALGPAPPLRQGSERLRALQEKLRSLKRDP